MYQFSQAHWDGILSLSCWSANQGKSVLVFTLFGHYLLYDEEELAGGWELNDQIDEGKKNLFLYLSNLSEEEISEFKNVNYTYE